MLARLGGHDVTVLDRNPAGCDVPVENDGRGELPRRPLPPRPRERANDDGEALLWADAVVRGRRGHGAISAASPATASAARGCGRLADRAIALGTNVRFDAGTDDPPEADLVVAADGAGSQLRSAPPSTSAPRSTPAQPLVWLGTSKAFKAFTFAFEQTHAGLISFSAYPSSQEASPASWSARPRRGRARAGHGGTRRRAPHARRDLLPPARRAGAARPGGRTPAVAALPRDPQPHVAARQPRAHGRRGAHHALRVGAGTVLAVEDAIALADALRSSGGDLATALRPTTAGAGRRWGRCRTWLAAACGGSSASSPVRRPIRCVSPLAARPARRPARMAVPGPPRHADRSAAPGAADDHGGPARAGDPQARIGPADLVARPGGGGVQPRSCHVPRSPSPHRTARAPPPCTRPTAPAPGPR